MPVLPDKILEDFEIDAFFDRVNVSAEKIISDPKFKLTTPNLPGLSLLLKLQIRVFEKSLASSFAPIFLGKKALTGGFKEIKDTFEALKSLFQNPLQFLLDEGVNSVLNEFPFPIKLEIGGGPDINYNPPEGDGRAFNSFEDYSYVGVFNSSGLPSSGQYTTQQSSIPNISEVTISKITNSGFDNTFLERIVSGDEIQISDDNFLGTFIVNSSIFLSEDQSVRLNLSVKSIKNLKNGKGENTIPGFNLSSLKLNGCQLATRSFLQADGTLRMPLSSLGLNIPLLSSVSFVLGDFENVQDSSPTKQYIKKLSDETGVEFQELLGGVLEGKFPSLDFAKIQEETQAGIENSNEQSKKDLIVLARLLEIAVTNPCFLIAIIINYLKLLLLPIRVVVGVLKGLGELISGPIKLIKTVIKGITDPIGLICDLVSKSFLEVLRPYIQSPLQASNITWEEALNDPDDPSRGLQPLVSDMVCGDFSKKLKNYVPNPSFFENLNNSLNIESEKENGPQITFDLITEGDFPKEGQVLVNSDKISKITNFKVSSFSNTVENALPYLAYLTPGDEFSFQFDDQSGKYRISTKNFVRNEGSSYFDINVVLVKSILDLAKEKSVGDLLLAGINIDSLKASLSITNPDREFLFIIERYLPIKVVVAWEAIKGIIAVFGGLAQQVPSLIPAVLRSILGLNEGKSRAEIESQLDGGFNSPETLIDSTSEVLQLLFNVPIDSFLQTYSTESDRVMSLDKPGLILEGNNKRGRRIRLVNRGVFPIRRNENQKNALDAAYDVVQNEKKDLEPGVEDIFYDLYDLLDSNGLDTAIYRNKISPLPGVATYRSYSFGQQFLNFSKDGVGGGLFEGKEPFYPFRLRGRQDFYWGALNVKELGDSVKIRAWILLIINNVPWFNDKRKNFTFDSSLSAKKFNLEDTNIVVYGNDYNQDEVKRKIIFSGSVYDALNKYKITKLSYDKKESYYKLRVKILREIVFVTDFALPSLLES